MLLLRLESVHKSFPGVQALKPLSLELGEGEALGLIGENDHGAATYVSRCDRRPRFELGAGTKAGRLEIEWSVGTRKTLTGVSAARSLKVEEGK